jgi:hypothetical protein
MTRTLLTQSRTGRTTRTSLLFAVLAGCCISCGALAQSIPEGLAGKSDLSAADQQAIATFVQGHATKLSSNDPLEVREAREAILAPLERRGEISVAFRVQVANRLLDTLRENAKSSNDHVAVNALRLAGEIATSNSLEILETGLSDTRPAVRYAACFGLSRLYAAAARGQAYSDDEALRSLRKLVQVASTDATSEVVDGAIVAIAQARMTPTKDKKVRPEATRAVIETGSKLAMDAIKASRPVSMNSLVRIGGVVRDTLTETDVSAETARGASRFAGQLLLATKASMSGGGEAEMASRSARVAEVIIALASTSLKGPDFQPKLGDLLAAGKADQFEPGLKAIVGPGGLLQSAPFSVPGTDLPMK